MEKCWKQVQKGDMKAFGVIHEQIFPKLWYYAVQIIKDEPVAEEIVQDAFLKLWENRQLVFSSGQSLRTYMYRMVHNDCINLLARRKTQKQSLFVLQSSEYWDKIAGSYTFNESVIEKLYAEETHEKIVRLVDSLPEQCREIFRLSRFEEMTNEEIATRLNISVSTVKTQIYRALDKIKRIF